MNEFGSDIGSVDLGSDLNTAVSTRTGPTKDGAEGVRTDFRTVRDEEMTSADANLRCNPGINTDE